MNNGISFIVLTMNSKSYLKNSLESLCKNLVNGDEIILIDNGSSDNSVQIAQSVLKSQEHTIIKLSKNIGISAGRNLGAKYAKNDLISFIDSDIVLDNNCFVSARVKINDCDAIIGEYYEEGDGLNWHVEMTRELFAKKRKNSFNGPITFKDFATFSGGFCIIKKEVFLEIGGYNVKYHGAPCEDIHFEFNMLKNSKKIMIDKNFTGHHKKKKLRFKGFVKRAIYSGKGAAYLIKSSFKQKVLIPFNLQWPRLALFPILFIILLAIFKQWSLIALGVITLIRLLTIIFSIKKKYSVIRLINYEVLRFINELVLGISTIFYLLFYWKRNYIKIKDYPMEIIK